MSQRYTASDISFEGYGFLGYLLAVVAIGVSGSLPAPAQLVVAGAIAVAVTAVSLDRRRRFGWRHPRLRAADWLEALAVPAIAGLTISVISPALPAGDPALPTIFLSLAGAVFFLMLRALKWVDFYEPEFRALGSGAADSAVPNEPRAQHVLRMIYRCGWVVVFALMVFTADLDLRTTRNAPSHPVGTATAPLSDGSSTVYVTPELATLIPRLRLAFIVAGATLLLGTMAAERLLGVSVFAGRRYGKSVS